MVLISKTISTTFLFFPHVKSVTGTKLVNNCVRIGIYRVQICHITILRNIFFSSSVHTHLKNTVHTKQSKESDDTKTN